jgi:hypothetical protein
MNGPTHRPFPHGTAHGYNNLGCRCADCRDANTASTRDYRARKRGHPTATRGNGPAGHPERGRPRDVLAFIDFILEPDRPVMFNLNGGVAEACQVLPVAIAGMWAAQARLDYAKAEIDALVQIKEGLEALEELA